MKNIQPNTILIIVASLIVAVGAYWFFFMRGGTDAPLTAEVPTSGAEAQFQILAEQLPRDFDTSIFSDVRFNALVDITTPIAPETAGRPDPLAPIPGVSGIR